MDPIRLLQSGLMAPIRLLLLGSGSVPSSSLLVDGSYLSSSLRVGGSVLTSNIGILGSVSTSCFSIRRSGSTSSFWMRCAHRAPSFGVRGSHSESSFGVLASRFNSSFADRCAHLIPSFGVLRANSTAGGGVRGFGPLTAPLGNFPIAATHHIRIADRALAYVYWEDCAVKPEDGTIFQSTAAMVRKMGLRYHASTWNYYNESPDYLEVDRAMAAHSKYYDGVLETIPIRSLIFELNMAYGDDVCN